MAEALKRIPISPESELARELKTAKNQTHPIAVDTGDTVYEVFVSRTQPATSSDDAVARSIAGIKDAAGSWKDIDIEAFDAYRAERRKVHTRPPVEL
jgi:hypothetical protein